MASGQKDSLEYKTYQNLIRKKLKKFGYQEVEPQKADLKISFGYSISGPQERIGSSPVYGQTGIRSSTTTGSVSTTGSLLGYGDLSNYSGHSNYSSRTTYTPSYGVVGSRTYTYNTYTRVFELFIYDGKATEDSEDKRIYEGTAISTGTSSSLPKVIPYLIEALFQGFPGKSGEVRQIKLFEGSASSS